MIFRMKRCENDKDVKVSFGAFYATEVFVSSKVLARGIAGKVRSRWH